MGVSSVCVEEGERRSGGARSEEEVGRSVRPHNDVGNNGESNGKENGK